MPRALDSQRARKIALIVRGVCNALRQVKPRSRAVVGSAVVFIGGTYREISPPHRIVFSWLIEPPDEHAGIESRVKGDAPTSDIVLVPHERDNVYEQWAPLYHLLPRGLLMQFNRPLIARGVCALRDVASPREVIRPQQRRALEAAFAQRLWSHGRPRSPLVAFSKDDSLKLLSHDLSYWRAHMKCCFASSTLISTGSHAMPMMPSPESVPTKYPSSR